MTEQKRYCLTQAHMHSKIRPFHLDSRIWSCLLEITGLVFEEPHLDRNTSYSGYANTGYLEASQAIDYSSLLNDLANIMPGATLNNE